MKKILITVLIILLIILGTFTIMDGIHIGGFEVLGYSQIIEMSQKLEDTVTQASQLTSVTFPEKISNLTSASKKLITTREQYQDKVAYSSEEDVRRANEIKTYQVDFLFTRLGNYAKQHGINMDLQANPATATGVFNLNFTLHGKYVLISDFIRDIENDSQLNFVIENFKLTPDTSNEILKAEFLVTELKINADSSIVSPSITSTQINTQGTNTTTNTSMNTATTDTTNTTNTANTLQ